MFLLLAISSVVACCSGNERPKDRNDDSTADVGGSPNYEEVESIGDLPEIQGGLRNNELVNEAERAFKKIDFDTIIEVEVFLNRNGGSDPKNAQLLAVVKGCKELNEAQNALDKIEKVHRDANLNAIEIIFVKDISREGKIVSSVFLSKELSRK